MNKLSQAFDNLGFKSQPQSSSLNKFSNIEIHEAIINNLYLAGYFEEQLIWQAINLIGFDKYGNKTNQIWTETPQLAFLLMYKVIKKSGALQDNITLFKPQYLLEHLFAEYIFDIEDIEDFIVYLTCQNAFDRIPNKERHEIAPQIWMQIYKQQYLQNAQKISLVEEIKPTLNKYDEIWVMGTGRYSDMMSRLSYLKRLIDSGFDIGKIRLLSGNHEIWVDMDNISDSEEAKNFMIKIANKNNIKINNERPFIVKSVLGRPRTYINYHSSEARKLTETLMIDEMYENIVGKNEATLIDDHKKNYCLTTEGAVGNVAKYIFQDRLEEGDLKDKSQVAVMIISNQPYCERQKLTTERIFDKVLHRNINKKIIFDAAGESASNILTKRIHSEFAALMAEKFWQYTKKTSHTAKRKRSPQKMIFSRRYKDISFVPSIPTSIIPSIS